MALTLTARHDISQVRDKAVTALLALLAARLRGVPFVYWMSFPFPEYDLLRARTYGRSLGLPRLAFTIVRGLVTGWLLRRLLPRCDAIVVQSERMRRELMDQGLAPDKVMPLSMGVTLRRVAEITPADAIPGLPKDAEILVHMGKLDMTRETGFLLQVLKLVRERVPRAALLLIGDTIEPADMDRLKARIAQEDLRDHVAVTGWLPQEEAWRLAASARVGILNLPPGYVFDSMSPTKAVEFLALGLPVVGTEHPELAAMAHDSEALVCTGRDPGEFALAVTRILEDPTLAADMGVKGRRYVEHARSYEQLAGQLAGLYARLADAASAGPEPEEQA